MMIDPSIDLAPLMRETIAISSTHVHRGGIPFAALVVGAEGNVLGRGVNRVREQLDPTAHAEIDAIRDACRRHHLTHLHGATLLASAEPCAMCYLNALHAGISQVLFAADRDEAAAHGFDYRGGYAGFANDPTGWPSLAAGKLAVPAALEPFTAFARRHGLA